MREHSFGSASNKSSLLTRIDHAYQILESTVRGSPLARLDKTSSASLSRFGCSRCRSPQRHPYCVAVSLRLDLVAGRERLRGRRSREPLLRLALN